RPSRRRRAAGAQDFAALRHCHAARQSIGARWRGTHRRLHDVSRRRDAVLLPDRRARKRCGSVSGDVPAHRPVDPADRPPLTRVIMNVNGLLQNTSTVLLAVALKVIGAIVLWLIGRRLIAFALGLVQRAFEKQRLDATLARYMQTALEILLNLALAVALLG